MFLATFEGELAVPGSSRDCLAIAIAVVKCWIHPGPAVSAAAAAECLYSKDWNYLVESF